MEADSATNLFIISNFEHLKIPKLHYEQKNARNAIPPL